jgi:hypothetical protein
MRDQYAGGIPGKLELRRFTNMSALLYTGSVLISMMGLISEQITALMYKDGN